MSTVDIPPLSDVNRFIRKISIVILLPAAPILIAGGICAKTILIAGLWVHVFSSVFGTYLLVNANKENAVKPPVAMCLDVCMGFLYLGLLIPVWIQPISGYYQGWTEVMLAAYGTCFMIINMAIHLYFGVYSAFTSKFIQICWEHECPICRAQSGQERDGLLPTTATTTTTADKGSHYSLLKYNIDDVATPRTSEEHV